MIKISINKKRLNRETENVDERNIKARV